MDQPTTGQRQYDVFVSYRSTDAAVEAEMLTAELRSRGLSVFLDQTAIREGAFIPGVIVDAIARTRVLVIWYSRAYAESVACLLELARFLSGIEGTPSDRLLVLNPEATAAHIRPAWLLGLRHAAVRSRGDLRPAADLIERSCRTAQLTDHPPRVRRPGRFGDYPGETPAHLLGHGAQLLEIYDGFHAAESADASKVLAAREVVVSGPSMIGKSALILHYVQLFDRLYPGGIFWLVRGTNAADDPAERLTELALEAGLVTAAEVEGESANSAAISRHVRRRLEARGPYLWIVEGGTDADAPGWRPPTVNGRHLAARRVAADLPGAVHIRVDPLPSAAVIAALRQAVDCALNDGVVARFAVATFGLPGEVARVAAQIRDFGADEALAFYEREPLLAARLEMSYARPIAELTAGEVRLLDALSLVQRAQVPVGLSLELHRLAALEAEPHETLRRLRALGLIELRGAKGIAVVEPVRRLRSHAAGGSGDLLVAALAAAMPRSTRARLSPDLLVMAAEAKRLTVNVSSDAAASLLQRLGTFLALTGDHAGEQMTFSRAHDWLLARHGAADQRTMEAAYELATCFRGRAAADRLEPLLDLYRKNGLPPDRLKVHLLQTLGIALEESGDVPGGLERLEEAAGLLAMLGPSVEDPARGAAIQNSRALILKRRGRESEALAAIVEAERLARELLPAGDADLLRISTNKALWSSDADSAAAVRQLTENLKCNERIHGTRHHLTTWAAYNLFSTLVEKAGDWTAARALFLRRLAWLFRGPGGIPRNHIHAEVGMALRRGNDGTFLKYLTPHLPRVTTLEQALDRSELMLMIEYLSRGAEGEAFAIVLGDYVEVCERESKRAVRVRVRVRMVRRFLAAVPNQMDEGSLRYGRQNYRQAKAAVERYLHGYGREEWGRTGYNASTGGNGGLARLLWRMWKA